MDVFDILFIAEKLSKRGKYDEAFAKVEPLFDTCYAELAYFRAGKIMMHAQNEEKAWEYFNKFISYGEDNESEVYLWLGSQLAFNPFNNMPEAQKYLKKAVHKDPTKANKSLFQQLRINYLKGNYQSVDWFAKILLEIDYKKSDVLFFLGKVKCSRKQLNEAIDCFKEIIDINDTKVEQAANQLIRIYDELGNDKEASKYRAFMKEITTETEEDRKLLDLADDCLNNGLYKEASACFKTLKDKSKLLGINQVFSNVVDSVISGDENFINGDYSRAINDYKKGLRSKYTISHSLVGLRIARILKKGDRELLFGNIDEALEIYNQLTDDKIYEGMDESKLEIMANLICYLRIKTIHDYYEILKHGLKPKLSSKDKGNVYLKIGMYDKAKDCYYKSFDEDQGIGQTIAGLIAIKIKNNDLNDLYNFLDFYKDQLTHVEYTRIKIYINWKTNESFAKKYEEGIVNYLIDNNKNDYCSDIDIKDLFYKIKEQVADGSLTNGGKQLSSAYYIDCQEPVGYDRNGLETNIVKVFSFMEKDNIIHMYPTCYDGPTIPLEQKVKRF